jgi:integrase
MRTVSGSTPFYALIVSYSLRKALRVEGRPKKLRTGTDRAGGLWRENSLIFASESGEPLDRRDITTHRFKPLLKRAELPQIRFHDLRHTCATLLLTKNVNPKVVSEMLGHSNIAITLDTYSHVLPNMQDSAARALEEALR